MLNWQDHQENKAITWSMLLIKQVSPKPSSSHGQKILESDVDFDLIFHVTSPITTN